MTHGMPNYFCWNRLTHVASSTLRHLAVSRRPSPVTTFRRCRHHSYHRQSQLQVHHQLRRIGYQPVLALFVGDHQRDVSRQLDQHQGRHHRSHS